MADGVEWGGVGGACCCLSLQPSRPLWLPQEPARSESPTRLRMHREEWRVHEALYFLFSPSQPREVLLLHIHLLCVCVRGAG